MDSPKTEVFLMARALRFYDLLHRLSFAASFRAKVVVAVFASVLVPIGILQFYFVLFSPLHGESLERAILVSGLAAGGAATMSYWALSTILRPLSYASRQLDRYLTDRTLPEPPVQYKDEVGLLMANINYVARCLEEHHQNTTQNAAYDHLTGVYNRRASESRLRDSIELSRIRQTPLSFAILDLDNFKRMNDSYGHDYGDTVLRQIGELLRQNVRRSDWVGRWGGDEFVLAIHGNESEAMALVSRLCEVVRRDRVLAPDQTIQSLSISVGVCEWNESMEAHSLYTKADEALYTAKRQGRDQVQVWSELAAV
jgi:diguanylate cyclase (GGDEF)-like protein